MITSAKKRRLPTGYSDSSESDEDVSVMSTARASSALLNRIWAVKSGKKTAATIKDALRVGETYNIVDIETVNTYHGRRQVWSLRGAEDKVIKKVFSCTDLHQFTTNVNGELDLEVRGEMIKQIRVVYRGVQKPQGNELLKYEFDFLDK